MQIAILAFVTGYTMFGINGLLHLEQKFDPSWFIPSTTYLSKYMTVKDSYYPDMGYEGGIYLGNFNYSTSMTDLIQMSSRLKNRSDIILNYNSWVEPFHDYVLDYHHRDLALDNVTETEWKNYLTQFLYSHEGGRYQGNFGFKTKIKCGKPAPNISVSFFSFQFKRFENRSQYVPAMHDLTNVVERSNLQTQHKFVWGKIFGNWITDEIIDGEVLRNIILALICVMFCTTILITNIHICFWIFACVLLTLINVSGFMYIWGLTIDLVSCIALQLAVGLCVDYAAHIGHTFLTFSDKSRTKRAVDTVTHIGAAVLYGGLSTILGLAMLAGSDAYVFTAFFRIFLLVIVFGLFHGIVLLPVILSIVGPPPHKSDNSNKYGPSGTELLGDRELLNINSADKKDIKFISTSSNGLNGKFLSPADEERNALNDI